MKPDVPPWRVWLVTLLAALWGLLGLYTARRADWPVAALCAVLFAWNAYQLWQFTRGGGKP